MPHSKEKLYSDRNRSVLGRRASVRGSRELDNFDVIFLDIEMGQADGITVARKIRETDKNVLIIYVTSHESYMQESFSVRPFRFFGKTRRRKTDSGLSGGGI